MNRQSFLVRGVLALVMASSTALAQDTFHIFPQFADGWAPGGSYFRSTLTILPWSPGSSPGCTLVLYGMTSSFGGPSSYYFSATVPQGQVMSAPTLGTQALQAGYGTLNCSDSVHANLILTYYAADNRKLGEATVTSSREAPLLRIPFDERGGVRQAVAIANNTDFARRYIVSLGANGVTRSNRVVIPARRNLARFVDELVTVSPESLGILTIQSEDYSYFSAVGFRFTGGLFTTIPAN